MMASNSENTQDILIIYEEDTEEWALYLKSVLVHVVSEDGILLCDLEMASIQPSELQPLYSYRCKLLILSSRLLNCLNLKKRYFLDKILQPPESVVIFLCGIENSAIIYQILNIDQNNQLITTDQDPEVYIAVIINTIQRGPHGSLSMGLRSELKLADRRVETEKVSETLARPAAIVLPTRISCESPEEIFILLRDEVPDDSVVVEFITENDWIRTEPEIWNQKVRCMKALEFPAGFVNVNVYCEGVIKATTQIEYYTTIGEIDRMLQKVANPIAFACQACKFSPAEKVDSILTFLLKSSAISHDPSSFLNEVTDHYKKNDSHLEELPTLLHCAAKFGFRELATLLLQCPEAIQACKVANKNGENPAQLAKKYGRNEIWKIIQELPIDEDNYKSDGQEEEEDTEDDVYVIMTSDSSCNVPSVRPSTSEQPGASLKIQNGGTDDEAEQQEDAQESAVENKTKGERNGSEETPHHHLASHDKWLDDVTAKESSEANLRGVSCAERPTLPPRIQPSTTRQNELFYLSPAWEAMNNQKETKETNGDQKEDDEAEDPYTSAMEDNGIYDMILTNAIKERKKESRSFIMNRPPAPAPRPSAVPMKEENTPYIAQVFQQKVTRNKAGDEKLLYAVRKPDRPYDDRITYSTVKPSIPLGQEELILLQEQVKRGTISMDEAVEKFKQWQVHKKGLEATQQEKIRQFRDSIIRKRPEEESLYDKITIIHHPNVSMKRGKNHLNSEGVLYAHPFTKQALL
ncbi:B-cell scaffold protein with ankyrin repeats [Varanus komodoensis]|uniref:B-cell scaffold protein with ankyrin repeats n=1 Tax=Varanus komodoensis TaxID=61221 RepID=UPI001CF77FF4|nr:B-cell scaffold protein with ankyrin repeats [Varanus komodoensis]